MTKIVGNDKNNVLTGGKGDDKIYGYNGNDILRGGDGNDVLFGMYDNDKMFGEDGDDVLVMLAGKDTADGGKGLDLLDFYNTRAVNLDLGSGKVSYRVDGKTGTTEFKNMEGAYGSFFDDKITGDNKDNSLFSQGGNDKVDGGGGNDTINAFTGNDRIKGGTGNDLLIAQAGKDKFDGGEDSDTIDLRYAKSAVSISLDDGVVSFKTDAGKGKTTFTDVENLNGSKKNDTLTGNEETNTLIGAQGKDKLFGLGGDDILSGGEGDDKMTGGEGMDAFVFAYKAKDNGLDKIMDFTVADDGLYFYKNVFDVKGTGPVMEFAGYEFKSMNESQFQSSEDNIALTQDVRFIYETDTGILYYDENGSKAGKRTEIAQLAAELTLTADDFFVV